MPQARCRAGRPRDPHEEHGHADHQGHLQVDQGSMRRICTVARSGCPSRRPPRRRPVRRARRRHSAGQGCRPVAVPDLGEVRMSLISSGRAMLRVGRRCRRTSHRRFLAGRLGRQVRVVRGVGRRTAETRPNPRPPVLGRRSPRLAGRYSSTAALAAAVATSCPDTTTGRRRWIPRSDRPAWRFAGVIRPSTDRRIHLLRHRTGPMPWTRITALVVHFMRLGTTRGHLLPVLGRGGSRDRPRRNR